MKLSILFEADMNRRGFLKLLGKGAAAAMAPPDIAMKGLGALSKLPGRKLSDSALDDAFWSYVDDWDYRNDGPADVKAPIGVVGKWLYNKIINQLQSPESSYAFDLMFNSDRNSELDNYAKAAMEKVCQNKGPAFVIGKLFHPSTFSGFTPLSRLDPNNLTDLVVSTNEGMWRHYFDELSTLAHKSPSVKNLMLKHGLSPAFNSKPTAMRLKDFMKDSGVITPDEYEIAKNIEDLIEKHKQKISKSSDAHLEREVGYEREGQFDPRSSRPAQALGPFESRLRKIL